MQDENDWNALFELIRSGSGRRFVLLSRGAPSGCLIAFRYSEVEKILPCAAQSNTIKPPVR